jgi:ribonuclease P/MRP protein subunit RPP1
MFYDLHVHTMLSIGENTVDECAEMARKLGINGIGIARYFNGTLEELPRIEGVDLINCLIIKPSNPEELQNLAKKARIKAEVLMVHGGDYKVNRAACENSYIDVLCHPELGRRDSGLDHTCIKVAADNNVAIEVNFREVLESHKRQRVYVLSAMRKNVALCRKYDAKVITTSGSVSKWSIRAGRELAALTHLLGLELGIAIDSVSAVPEEIVRTNREKLAGRRWEGVSIVEE